ncbi:MAG: hypothetical protein E6G97_16135 [Alphaproteobacteria bacterium]|nr:MAG: hypothetical protein E6G97_16135 [Alphaproteobacteria bacterium]
MAGTLDGQLWFINNGAPADAVTGHLNSDGSNVTQEGIQAADHQSVALAVDIAAGYYFTITGHLTLEMRSVTNPAVVLHSVQIGNDLNTAGTGDDDIVNTLAIDPFTHTLYVGLWGQDVAHTGIVKVDYNPVTGALDTNNTAAYGSAGVYDANTQYLVSNLSTFTDARDFFIDYVNHKLYFTDDDNQYSIAPFHATNNISVLTYNAGNPGATITQLTTNAQFPTNQSSGIIGPMAVDIAKGLVYFETNHVGNSTGTLWYMPVAGGTATQLGLPAGTAVGFGDIPQGGISIDQQSHYIFITVQSGSAFAGPDQILQGQLSADGHSVTSWVNTYSLATLDGHAPDVAAHVADTWFDQLPTLTLTGTSSHVAEQGAKVDLTSAATTTTDTDGNHLASLTVHVSAGTFTANESSSSDDNLTVNDAGVFKTSGTFGATNITISYVSGTETLTLSGYDTLANYQSAFDAITFHSTGDNPTDYGLNNTRTIQWTASDGARNVPFGAQNTQSTTITIDAQNDGPNVQVLGGNSASIAVNETNSGINQSRSLTITDPDSLTETLTLTNFTNSGPTGGISDATLQGYFSIPSSVGITQATGSASFNWTFNSGSEAFNFLGAGQTLTLNYNIHDVDSNDSNGPGSASLSDDQAISVVITGVNDAPVVTAGNTTPYTENDPATTISPSATIADVDSPDFNNGSLTVAFTANGTAADQLTIQNQGTAAGQIGVSGATITYGGLTIGTFTGGTNGSNLVISFTTTDATQAAAQALLDHIQYANNSDNPSTATRTVTYTLNDGDGTANSGTNTGTATANITVTAVNDPPVNNKPGLQIVNEDAALVFNAAHSNLISISDPDAQSGNETVTLAVNHGTLTLGTTLNISIDAGANNSSTVTFHGTLANVNTALNGLSYSATANFNGSDTLTITTNDNSNSPTSPNNPLQDQDTVAITVSPVNDAPTVVNGTSVSLAAIAEDTASPPGVAVNALLSTHFSDALDDQLANGGSAPNNFAGIAVIQNSATGGQGTWEYSTNGGGSWTPFPAGITSTTALLIAATDMIHFVPAANFNGAPGSLTVNLVDDSSGAITTGGMADLTITGGTSRYSSATITIGETVNSVNDAPTFTGLDNTPTFIEGGAAVVLDGNALAHDVELDALNAGSGNYNGATLTLARHLGASAQDVFAASGTLQLTAGNVIVSGTTVGTFTNTGGTLAITFNSNATTARVASVLDQVTYSNTSDAPPSSVQIDYTLNDGNAGSQGSGGALAANGSITVSITPQNDAPDVTPNLPTAVTYVTGQSGSVGLLSTGAVSDPDQPANFNGGDLTVAIGSAQAGDEIVFNATSPFTDNAGTLMDGATAIGTITGLGSNSVSITGLTAAATPSEVSKLLEAFGFDTTSASTGDRTVTFTFHDGGNVGGGAPGASDAVTQTVHVTQPVTGQLYYRINNGPDDQVGAIHADGSGHTTVYSTGTNETSIAIDPAAGLVFTVGVGAHSTFDGVSVHNIHTGAFITKFIFGPDTGAATDDVVQALALDPFTHTLYVGDRGLTTDTTGVRTLTYNPTTGLLTDNGFLFTATQTETTPADPATTQFTNAVALSYDHANHLLYYADDDSGLATAPFHPTNGVYVVDTTGPTFTPIELTSNGNLAGQFPTDGSNGKIVGLAVDVAHGIVFFETSDTANSAKNALWWVNASGANQTATQISLPGGVSLNYAGDAGAGGIAAGLTFDAANQHLYLTNAYQDGATHNVGAIYTLLWDNGTKTVSSVTSFDTATLVGQAPGTVSVLDAPSVTAFDDAPTLAVTSAGATFTESATNPASGNNTPVTLLNSSTVGDPDGAGNLAGATVSISSGFLTGDLLSVTLTGNITVQSNSGGVLVLTGTDTFANYQTVLNSVQYTSTSENPTNYGADTSRTITWSVTDGVLSNPTPITTTVAVAGTNDAPANTVGGAQAVNEDTSLAFTAGNTISVADADNQSLSVTVSALHGGVTLGSVTNLTVSGNGTHSVTISGTTTDLNSALATLSYQGDANFNGADVLTVATTDGIVGSPTSSTVNITVNAVDDAPSGADNAVSTPVGTPYVFDTANVFGFSDAVDQVPSGSSANSFAAVKITTITLPAGATLQNNGVTVNAGDTISAADVAAHHLVFTAASGAGGANYAHFTFQVQDNGSAVAPNANLDATPNLMTINVGSGFGPTAAADSYPVLEAATVTGTAGTGGTGVFHNDNGTGLTVTAVNGSGGNVDNSTAGTYGHLTLHADGSFSYVADQTAVIDAVGSATHPIDTFNYTVTDDQSLSATTTVSFSVDRPPTTATHTVDVPENTSVGPVSANDVDPDGDPLTVTAVSGGAVGAPLAGTYGSVTINPNDTYSYSADNTANINAAATGSHPIDIFTYTVDDGLGGTATETFHFSVDRTPSAVTDNDPANDNVSLNGAVTEGAGAGTTVGITGFATDPDGDAIAYSLTANPGGFFTIDSSTGVVSVATNGATGIDFETAPSHAYSITVQAADGHGLTTSQSFTIAVNDAAASAPADSDTATADSVVEGAAANTYTGLTALSSDPNGGTIVYSLTSNPGGAFKINSSNGQVSVNDPAAVNYESAPGHALTVTVQAATTGGTLVSTHDFSIAITNASPSTPTDGDGTANSVTEGAAADTLVHVTAASTDVNGPPVTYSITSDQSSGGFKIDSASGVVSVADATKINYETAPGHAYSITVQASDGAGGTSSQSFSIAVGDVAPTAADDTYDGTNSVNEDQTLTVAAADGVLANDSDVNGGPITAVLDFGPTNAASFTLNPDGSFSYTPAADFNGTDSFTYHAFDGSQSSGIVTATITVNPVNDAPALSGVGDAGDTPAFTEGLASVRLDTGQDASVSDFELDASGANYEGASLLVQRLSGPNPDDVFTGTGTLDLSGSNGLGENVSLDGGATFIGTASQPGDGSFSITFNANATAADIDDVMRQILYANVSDNPPTSVQIAFALSDGNGVPGGQDQGSGATPGIATGTFTVTITQVDDAPVLVSVAPSASYAIGSPGVTLSAGLGVFDPDATPPSLLTGIANATVKIQSGLLAGDQLFVNLTTDGGGHFITPDLVATGISGSYVAGTLTLTGNDSVSHYQSVLDAVSYKSTAADPTNGGTDTGRTITWSVNDGALNSAPPVADPNNPVNVTFLHFATPPILDLDASAPGTGFTTTDIENTAAIPIVDTDVSITDGDSAAIDQATIVLTNAKPHDLLTIAGTLPGGIASTTDTSVPGQITMHLSNSATLADYQTALGQLRFSTTDLDLSDRDITISVSNDLASNTAHATVHVVPLHLFGTTGNDSYTATPGHEIIDAGAGVDTITFGFRLVDATVTYSGNHVIIDGPGSHTVLSGFEVFNFTDGTVHNDDGSPLIDDLFYYSQYHDVWNAHVDADTHYNTLGWHELRDPNAFFDTNLYLSANPDVRASGANPLTQYDTVGWTQHRIPSLTFNGDYYLAANPDVAAAHVDPLLHFLANGAGEGRQPIAPTEWLMPNGFDFVYYMQHNPDVAAAKVDPYVHFETTGWKEGRNPNALFDTNGYLAAYSDIAAAHINPLDHFHTSGWLEGRDPSGGFDTNSYLAAYPDVAAAHIDPLVHYLANGIHEGRLTFADGSFHH